ncbi:G protein-coupled glucose receptor regulating Gpa2-domain-containing protein [Coniochaeta sp. 2T2.1]|nr:G protein-coupled glucose receptor regulating Gpa2-domain-containing protein [Coniochaeta sp. 2T2.1]
MKNIYDSEDASGTIAPLPPVLTHGLAAVATFGFLSFFSTLGLFGYLTYKLIVWQLRLTQEKRSTSPEPESPTTSDVNGFLVPESHFCPPKETEWEPPKESIWKRLTKEPPNQFLVLIYNLLFADIQQALAFMLNVTWLSRDAVQAGTSVCWAQGWFISTGDLASSVFITAIAIHTYLGVIRGYRVPTWAFYAAIALLWAFVYGTAILGVIITENGRKDGGLYVRAGAWCWINSAYQNLRLTLHYLWIFISLALTTIVYLVIFYHLHLHRRHSPTCCLASGTPTNLPGEHYPNPDPNGPAVPSIAPSSPRSAMSSESSLAKRLPPVPSSARHPTFLLYPLIYVLCTAPLAAGRIASMAGNDVSLAYFCFAGCMIASAGWLDVALYSSTRRSIVFSGEAPPSQDTGIETFAFMRTPAGRKFGNVVFVSGGEKDGQKGRRWAGWNGKVMSGARLRTLAGLNRGSGGTVTSRNGSKETLGSMKGFGMGAGEVMGMAIQCETVTTVVVEEVEGGKKDRKGSLSSNVSLRTE